MGFFDSFKKHSHLSLSACMLGACGVGKTSVLTAISDDSKSKDGFTNTSILFEAADDTEKELGDYRRKLKEVFDNRGDISAIPATTGVHTYKFEMGVKGKPSCIDLTVTDYKGEHLTSDPKDVTELIRKSSIILLPIDTPYLMENNGTYNEEKNKVQLTTSFIINNLDAFQNKLVMIVPLKCEKYLDLKAKPGQRKDMSSQMLAKICGTKGVNPKNNAPTYLSGAYSEMINKLIENDSTAVVVSPIITVGGVAFDRFVWNESEQIHVAKYKFYDGETSDGIHAKYKPVFCSQPIFYMLSFMAQQYKRHRNSGGIIERLWQSISNFFDKNEQFLQGMAEINKLRITNGNGYAIICGHHLFISKND